MLRYLPSMVLCQPSPPRYHSLRNSLMPRLGRSFIPRQSTRAGGASVSSAYRSPFHRSVSTLTLSKCASALQILRRSFMFPRDGKRCMRDAIVEGQRKQDGIGEQEPAREPKTVHEITIEGLDDDEWDEGATSMITSKDYRAIGSYRRVGLGRHQRLWISTLGPSQPMKKGRSLVRSRTLRGWEGEIKQQSADWLEGSFDIPVKEKEDRTGRKFWREIVKANEYYEN